MEKKYLNNISNDKTPYPFRFKTENEFTNEYGVYWRSEVGWANSGYMDNLFGKDFKLESDEEKFDKLYSNVRLIYNNKKYINYIQDGYEWDICREMLTKNIKYTFKQIYMNTKKNTYESIQVLRYSDFDNLEYRKGSKEYGGIITKLLEFLRLYNTQEDLIFKVDVFIKKSNITIEEIQKLLQSKEKGQKLYDFEILLDNNTITFKNLNKTGKNRPFESINN